VRSNKELLPDYQENLKIQIRKGMNVRRKITDDPVAS